MIKQWNLIASKQQQHNQGGHFTPAFWFSKDNIRLYRNDAIIIRAFLSHCFFDAQCFHLAMLCHPISVYSPVRITFIVIMYNSWMNCIYHLSTLGLESPSNLKCTGLCTALIRMCTRSVMLGGGSICWQFTSVCIKVSEVCNIVCK